MKCDTNNLDVGYYVDADLMINFSVYSASSKISKQEIYISSHLTTLNNNINYKMIVFIHFCKFLIKLINVDNFQ